MINKQNKLVTNYFEKYDQISLEIKPLTVCIDEAMVADVMILLGALTQILDKSFTHQYLHKYFYIVKTKTGGKDMRK